mmetsp:Transcript_116019/g.237229  ORF Transcript_116019/g.237229 Transcript_116019/m.237229 type:complete len:278 (-) Transcript_116019:667-1500(-)
MPTRFLPIHSSKSRENPCHCFGITTTTTTTQPTQPNRTQHNASQHKWLSRFRSLTRSRFPRMFLGGGVSRGCGGLAGLGAVRLRRLPCFGTACALCCVLCSSVCVCVCERPPTAKRQRHHRHPFGALLRPHRRTSFEPGKTHPATGQRTNERTKRVTEARARATNQITNEPIHRPCSPFNPPPPKKKLPPQGKPRKVPGQHDLLQKPVAFSGPGLVVPAVEVVDPEGLRTPPVGWPRVGLVSGLLDAHGGGVVVLGLVVAAARRGHRRLLLGEDGPL